MNKKNQNIAVFFKPSLLSGTITILMTAYLATVTIWTGINDSAIVKQSLELFSNRVNDVGTLQSTQAVFSNVIDSELVTELFYVLLWALVGVLAYFGFLIIGKMSEPLKDIINIHSQVKRYRKTVIIDNSIKIAFRLLIGIILIFYMVILFQIIIPVAIGSLEYASVFNTFGRYLALAQALFLLLLSFHFIVLLLRLFAMRLRVFGGSDYYL